MRWLQNARGWPGARSLRRVALAFAIVAAIVGIPAIVLGSWAVALQLSGNVHVVEPGQLYRAAQLNGAELDDVLNRYGIRTIINLRGVHAGQRWYDDEVAVARQRGLIHVDVPMSATREPDEATLQTLMLALRDSPEPILVHCQSGADRTGLASALFELVGAGRPSSVAAEQLSFRYGHFPWLGSRTDAMDRTFERLTAHGGLRFLSTSVAWSDR